ncbi:MAG: hypothetical protein WED82_07870 [Balneolales bacterium]
MLLFSVIAIATTFLVLQTEYVKNILKGHVEQRFNDHFQGDISIGTLQGILPFQITVTDLELNYKDGVSPEQNLLFVDAVTLNPGLWDLFFNRVRFNNLVIENPSLYLKTINSTEYTLEHALQTRQSGSRTGKPLIREDRNFEIFIPAIRISSGRVVADDLLNVPEYVNLPKPFEAYDIDLVMRLEISEDQKYLDIETFNIDIPAIEASPINLYGQIFNDENYLELNQIHFTTNNSTVIVNSLIDGINLDEPDIFNQVKSAHYDVELASSTILTSDFADVLVNFPSLEMPVTVSGKARGFANDIQLTDMQIYSGDSYLLFSGQLAGLINSESFEYKAAVKHLNVTDQDLSALSPTYFKDFPFKDWDKLNFQGEIAGNADSTGVDIDLDLPKGSVNFNAWINTQEPWSFSGSLIADNIDVGNFPSLNLAQSSINIYSEFNGSGFNPETANFDLELDITNSHYDHIAIPLLRADLHYQDKILQPVLYYEHGATLVESRGFINYNQDEPDYSFSGEASQLNLSDFIKDDNAPVSSLNLEYDFYGQGETIDRFHGRANLDISESMVGGDTLQAHQLYADLDRPENEERTFRFTSTFLDMFIEGDIRPSQIIRSGQHWGHYFQDRITEEILLDSVVTRDPVSGLDDQSLDLSFDLDLKDMELFKSYLPNIPLIASQAEVQFNVKASANSFLISGGWTDRLARINGYNFVDPNIMLTAHFRHGRRLRDFSSMDIESRIGEVGIGDMALKDLETVISMRQDTLKASHKIDDLGDSNNFSTEFVGILDSLSITTIIQKMEMGKPGYLWESSKEAVITYNSEQIISIEHVVFENDNQLIDIGGVFSSSLEDSVTYTLENIDLNRISGLIDGRINFQGTLDAGFFTKSLDLQPIFQGGIFVDRFAIDDRPVGDINLTSNFNSDTRRFDTRLAIKTDTTKYASYLAGNDNIGQDIILEGYFLTPSPNNPQDTLYHFDADLNKIDLWVLPHIATGIFETVEGRGDGTGTIFGNWDDFDFNADLYAYGAYVKPVFFNTDYNITGRVKLDRHEGVFLDTLSVRDQAFGTGKLYGNIQFNNFQAERDLNITLELNSLTFLNNSFEPDAYFYGNVGGSGVVNVSGSNISPVVRTVEPVRTTQRSRLSIPLLDETRVESQRRSVQFVDDFNEVNNRRNIGYNAAIARTLDRDFAEVFQLDLQFIASENNIMQLVFDPVTGEILNATGGGRIRITLEDEELQMFGGFDITSGDYQFVGGDIFTRRFDLREGGSIRWDGDPVNARLDITAAYRSRPNINTLLAHNQISDQAQRVPVDLLLDITGTIENIANDFYFEFPSSVDATQNAAILALLNSEEQKLIQATSLLFTGGFIAGGTVGAGQTQEFGSTMQNRTAQVGLSHLLSNQINSLLNSNLSNLDIDFNLSGFDQADLGIALRLFDDRLVLHREGQVTGAQADIGDVGAKYQISNNLSVELFHRKDPALVSIVGTQGQLESVNGVGLEAQMEFNTWQQFKQRIWDAITGIFGGKNDEGQS